MGATYSTTQRLRDRLSTEQGVYGVILISGLIAVAAATEMAAGRTLLFTALTVLVFWAAHIYAGTVAMHGQRTNDGLRHVGLKEALRHSFTGAHGLLASLVLPGAVLFVSALGLIDDYLAQWIALWVNVGVLAMLGYVAYRRKGAAMHLRVLGALATASFGIFIVLVKALVTH